jgi:hypothetical protein
MGSGQVDSLATRREDRSDAVRGPARQVRWLLPLPPRRRGASRRAARAANAPPAAGERTLEEGDVVHFPVGPDGAHQLINNTNEPVRYLVASNRPSPEAVEYPDSRQISVMAFTESQLGRPLWDIRTLGESAGD